MTKYWLKYGNNVISKNGYTLATSSYDPLNPLGLPAYTIRCVFDEGYEPDFSKQLYPKNPLPLVNRVSSSPNTWDITYENTDWSQLLWGSSDGGISTRYVGDHTVEVLGANTSGVTNMHSLFRGNKKLTTVNLFDTSSVVDVTAMFFYCETLGSVPAFNLESCTTMMSMCAHCGQMTSFGATNTSRVTNMGGLFGGCLRLQSAPPVSQLDCSSAVNMSGMFSSCRAVTSIPVYSTGRAEDMSGIFASCSSLQSLPVLDTSNVTTLSGAFQESGILTLPAWDTHNVTNIFNLCYYSKLTAIPAWDMSNVTDCRQAFKNCFFVASGILDMYTQLSAQITSSDKYSQCFRLTGTSTETGAAEYAQIPAAWK
jgi:surface protein